LAGLEPVDAGRVCIGSADVTDTDPGARDIAMVFQNYALYPHMTVAENMGFALKLKKVRRDERDRRVREAARMLDLEPYLNRKPKALSGGQRQRVAMGRAIVREPAVFLMDEPLSNLDAKLRVETRANIAALQARLGTTTIYVTHDQVEAMTMGHRVAVLKDGLLQQCDTPRVLYDRPANAFVAGFIGSPAMNLKTVPLDNGGARLGALSVPLPRAALDDASKSGLSEVTLGVRPESFGLTDSHADGDAEPGLSIRVDLVEELGADAYLYGTAEIGGAQEQFVIRTDGRTPPRMGETVRLSVRSGEEHVFHPETGVRLG
ncbi:MAG TPA: ATP-binding cassette domain-containing protein, partial [Mycobacteriales bacterium]|nr:ATP-binding cassette domain-containing protein [Mycobacteriales bacterium]